jgi:hypothetical protein
MANIASSSGSLRNTYTFIQDLYLGTWARWPTRVPGTTPHPLKHLSTNNRFDRKST